MNTAMQIIREVNIQAEIFYDDAVNIGDHAAYALTKDHRAQMTGLENIAESALKVSDVLDYIKRQTSRFAYWRQTFPGVSPSGEHPSNEAFGERLLNYLKTDLKGKRDTIYDNALAINDGKGVDDTLRRRIYLLLIRQFLRQVVAQYEYRVSFDERGKRKG